MTVVLQKSPCRPVVDTVAAAGDRSADSRALPGDDDGRLCGVSGRITATIDYGRHRHGRMRIDAHLSIVHGVDAEFVHERLRPLGVRTMPRSNGRMRSVPITHRSPARDSCYQLNEDMCPRLASVVKSLLSNAGRLGGDHRLCRPSTIDFVMKSLLSNTGEHGGDNCLHRLSTVSSHIRGHPEGQSVLNFKKSVFAL